MNRIPSCNNNNKIFHHFIFNYRHVSNIRRAVAGTKIVDNSDEVEASSVGAAPTSPSFST